MNRRTFLSEVGKGSLAAAATAAAMGSPAPASAAADGASAGASTRDAADAAGAQQQQQQQERPRRLPEDLQVLAGDAAMLNKPDDLTVACYTFPNYHPSALHDRIYGKGWTEYNLVRAARPWFPGHHQPRGPLLGELDENLPSTWEKYVALAVGSGIDAFIWDWYWFDDQPVLHEALEAGFLQASNAREMKFACMWTNHDWGLLRQTLNPNGTIGFNERLPGNLLFKGPHHGLASAWRSLSYILARYAHLPNYWRIDGKPVITIWHCGALVGGVGGKDNAKRLLAELREFARKLGHDGIHFHVTGFWAREGDELGIDTRGAYNQTLYAAHQFQPPDVKQCDYGIACADVAFRMWPEGYKNSKAKYLPNVSPGWDSTPRYMKPPDWEKEPRTHRHQVIFHNESPAAFKAFVQSAFLYLNQRPDLPRIMTIGVWNEWTEGQYLLPDNRFGYGMLDALAEALGKRPAHPLAADGGRTRSTVQTEAAP